MKKSLCFWQLTGFVLTSVLGTLLHFLFEWSNENIIMALFSAINESIWEHIKLLYFPLLIFALIECRYLKPLPQNFWCAKMIGFLVGFFTIPVLYYTYTGALGVKHDWFNILIFFITTALVFFVEYKTMKNSRGCLISPTISKIFIFTLGALFIIFTFMPPKIPLFCNSLDSTYGYFKTI